MSLAVTEEHTPLGTQNSDAISHYYGQIAVKSKQPCIYIYIYIAYTTSVHSCD
jgi:hypothetical protein